MAKSIMQTERVCYITGTTQDIDLHHIYFGNPRRRISDENGFTVYLRHDIHMALHDHRRPFQALDHTLKMACQRKFEEMGHTREEFMRLIGRSYL